jgi:creatinine amidohydrolase
MEATMTRHLARMTWTQVAAALAHRPMVLVPLGALEPHGPHLPMGLDFLVAEHVAEAAAERTGSLIAPTLPHGYVMSSADFPGAVTLRAETLIALVEDTLRSLARHGATHLLLIDNHRSNNPYVEVAARRLRAETGVLVGSFFPWGTIINLAPPLYDNLAAVLGHGGEPETSVALHLYPDRVDMAQARPDRFAPFHGQVMRSAGEPALGKAAGHLWVTSREISETGITGDPTVADPGRGRTLVEGAIQELVRVIEAFRRLPAGTKSSIGGSA